MDKPDNVYDPGKSELVRLREENERLRQRVSELERQNERYIIAAGQDSREDALDVQSLRKRVAELEEENEGLDGTIGTRDETIADLRRQLDVAKRVIEKLYDVQNHPLTRHSALWTHIMDEAAAILGRERSDDVSEDLTRFGTRRALCRIHIGALAELMRMGEGVYSLAIVSHDDDMVLLLGGEGLPEEYETAEGREPKTLIAKVGLRRAVVAMRPPKEHERIEHV